MPYASTHRADVERYVDNVLSGRYFVGKHVKWAVERYLRDFDEASSRGIVFDWEIADVVIDQFAEFRHSKTHHSGKPFDLFDFQKFIVANLFGWRRADDYLRRFSKFFYSVARSNGKTAFAAALADIMTFEDTPIENRAESYCFATKEAQATKVIFSECSNLIKSNVHWRSNVNLYTKKIEHRHNGSILSTMGSDSKGSDGWAIHCAIVDELHEWRGRNHRDLYDKIRTAMGKRPQPMLVITSTEGDDRSDLYIAEYELCSQILDPDSSIEDDSCFAFIATADKSKPCESCSPETREDCETCKATGEEPIQFSDEKYWTQANPMLCETEKVVIRHDLRKMCISARVNPNDERMFRRYKLNQRTSSHLKLFSPELWSNGNVELRPHNGEPTFFGFDWGWKDDLSALAAVTPHPDGTYDLRAWAWCCSDGKRRLDDYPWAKWVDDGLLFVTVGNTTDCDRIYQFITDEILTEFNVGGMAFDGNNAREFGSKAVNEWGLSAYPFPQNCKKYNEPLRKLMALLAQGKVRHGGNPLLAWCANNAVAATDSDGYMMPKKDSSTDKIDPICAAIMALSESMFAEREECSFGFDVIRA